MYLSNGRAQMQTWQEMPFVLVLTGIELRLPTGRVEGEHRG
jgi:hypothetical protein